MSYRGEKFALALEMLASGLGSIQERLSNAVLSNNLLFLDSYFPEDDLREEYMDLKDGLEANIEKMSSSEASELISRIVSMYCEICKRD
jgi:hypothetical protein